MTKEMKEIIDELSTIETRSTEISTAVETAESGDLEKLSEEVTELESRKAELTAKREALEKAEAEARAVEVGKVKAEEVEKPQEARKMTLEELRASHEYNVAYAEMIKSGKEDEVRSLLTDLVEGGNIPTPKMVQDAIETAWEKTQIFSRLRKVSVKGTLDVPYEKSADEALIHVEGTDNKANEEKLVLGTVEIKPQMLKKFIKVTDEVIAMKGEAFLNYLNAELVQRISELADKIAVQTIYDSTLNATHTKGAKTYETILNALASLSDSAVNPVIIMKKADFFSAMAEAGTDGHPLYNIIRENGKPSYVLHGCEVLFNADATSPIVGDLDGLLVNLPEGQGVKFVTDPYSEAENDLVKIVARMYAGFGVTKPKFFSVEAVK